MKVVRGLLFTAAAAIFAVVALQAHALQLGDLDSLIRKQRESEAKIWKQREVNFRNELQQQEKKTRDAASRRNAAEARGKTLAEQSEQNFERIDEMNALLRQHQGNLGELFGVTRQVAGDSANVLRTSMMTTQFKTAEGQENRTDFMTRIAGAKELPNIMELERMWFELQREMTESGRSVAFKADVRQVDGSLSGMEVVRVGPFTATSGDKYLSYSAENAELLVMDRQPGMGLGNIAEDLHDAKGKTGYVEAVADPSRGALLGLYVSRPNFIERIQKGEVVGYVIVGVGILGVILAMLQYVYLFVTRVQVAAQLRNLANASTGNPLGRVLQAFRSEGKVANAELVELRLSEAVLRELPRLQRFQGFLRLCVAAGPLLGLIGTVIGMIITFHAITASGSSDPKLMAHGIGQAMIATVLGLGIAIPLLFINAGLTALSNGVTAVLDEQTQSLLAEDLIARRKEERARGH